MNRRAEENYRERVDRVVAHVVANPLAEHRLEDLAALCHFSSYHFHRVYSAVAGETVAATARRVRLAQAARLLEQGRQSITQVGLEVGYESPQAFARAFGKFTGQSPRSFQRAMHRVALDQAKGSPTEGCCEAPAVHVVERPAQRLHALRHHGPPATIPHTQRRLYLQCGTHAVERLGASFGAPDDSAHFRYYAAAALAQPCPVDGGGLELLEIPAGRYARHTLVGPYARIDAAITAIYSRWLPGSGYEPDDRPVLEHYLNSPRNVAPAELHTDLLIPIRPAAAP